MLRCRFGFRQLRLFHLPRCRTAPADFVFLLPLGLKLGMERACGTERDGMSILCDRDGTIATDIGRKGHLPVTYGRTETASVLRQGGVDLHPTPVLLIVDWFCIQHRHVQSVAELEFFTVEASAGNNLFHYLGLDFGQAGLLLLPHTGRQYLRRQHLGKHYQHQDG